MKLFLVYGEDSPHRDDIPFKTFIVAETDEKAARRLVSEATGFRVQRVAVAKDVIADDAVPAVLAWAGGPFQVID